ncbi:soluble cytochrome b562 [Haloferula luteola]|uniref:Soluble cytochrome b562 n=1 Tax=Haloferula luteola TaxID=595692 RepID=A0A840V763_9BACT|nr:cytochrome b562 [Haloferula luteola]MBB5353533.1 soluble cytochrome b562 [Haloferula luteola]
MKKLLFPLMAVALATVMPASADDTPLGESMESLNDAYKAMRRTDDAAEGAQLARDAQAALLKAFGETPELVEKGGHPEGKEKAMAAYRTQIAQALVSMCEIEAAFLAGEKDKVQELIGSLRDAKKKGHGEFMEDE